MKQIFGSVLVIFVVLIDVASTAKRSDKQQVKSREDALSWFNKYGYNPCLNSDVQCSLSLPSMVENYQQRFRLKVTGVLDETTKNHMSRSRCGNHDKPIAQLSSPAALKASEWSKSSLTYSIRSHPTQISEANTNRIIREAFNAWLEHIPLKIEPVCSTCSANIILDFARDLHSDTYPFDGIGGTLAHAFFPEDGRVHFDKDEPWTDSFDDANTNLYLVAVHEIGHALGLDHTYNEKSIMYPSYQSMQKKNILPAPDREAIQSRYPGKQSSTSTARSASTTTRSTTTTTVTTRKSLTTTKSSVTIPSGGSHPRCRRFLDAAFNHPDGTLHTFDAGVLWRYLPTENRWDNRATTFQQTYPNLPKRLAAGVYNSETKQIIFFTYKDVYQYDVDHSNLVKYRNSKALPKNLQNSIVGAIYYRGEIYVITSKTIRLFRVDRNNQLASERDLSEEFSRLPGTVTTAFSYRDLHYFFTKERLVYVWNERLNDWKTFGKPMETNWFACSTAETYHSETPQDKPSTRKNNHRDSHHRHHHHHRHHY